MQPMNRGKQVWFTDGFILALARTLPSGNLLHSHWKWRFIVDLPIKNDHFPLLCWSLPEPNRLWLCQIMITWSSILKHRDVDSRFAWIPTASWTQSIFWSKLCLIQGNHSLWWPRNSGEWNYFINYSHNLYSIWFSSIQISYPDFFRKQKSTAWSWSRTWLIPWWCFTTAPWSRMVSGTTTMDRTHSLDVTVNPTSMGFEMFQVTPNCSCFLGFKWI